jgi:hypothetical protein
MFRQLFSVRNDDDVYEWCPRFVRDNGGHDQCFRTAFAVAWRPWHHPLVETYGTATGQSCCFPRNSVGGAASSWLAALAVGCALCMCVQCDVWGILDDFQGTTGLSEAKVYRTSSIREHWRQPALWAIWELGQLSRHCFLVFSRLMGPHFFNFFRILILTLTSFVSLYL